VRARFIQGAHAGQALRFHFSTRPEKHNDAINTNATTQTTATMTTIELIKEAIGALKERTGSSVIAINKYIETEKKVRSSGRCERCVFSLAKQLVNIGIHNGPRSTVHRFHCTTMK
jgi:linker histone H1 and H5 family